MNALRKLARNLFRAASIVNTLGHIASGRPERVVKHLLRKALYKRAARGINKLG